MRDAWRERTLVVVERQGGGSGHSVSPLVVCFRPIARRKSRSATSGSSRPRIGPSTSSPRISE